MSGSAGQGQSRGELEAARTLNTVATIGAGHALWTSLPQESRERMARKVVPQESRAGRAVSRAARLVPKGTGRKAAIAGTAGWLGFHGAELAGDVMARRSINMQLDAKKAQGRSVGAKGIGRERHVMAKSIEQSFVSKAETAPVTGHGVNLEYVSKRYFDAESDRQRRTGMAAGALAGTSIVTGAQAMRGLEFSRGAQSLPDGSTRAGAQVGFTIPKGSKRTPRRLVRNKAALGAVALASGAGALGTYKYGISRRNRTWM